MKLRYGIWILCAASFLGSCGASRTSQPQAKLTVAAAANLTDVFAEVGAAFRASTGVEVVFSYASTAQLTQQIENGAPFDLFAAADTEHIDSLVSTGKLAADSRAVYATGQLVLWIPKGEEVGIKDLKDLTKQHVQFIAVAKPELAPYGQAAMETLGKAGLLQVLKPKIVYATSISQAKQFAETGNADAAFMAYSLVLHDRGTIVKIDRQLHRPIDQALAIIAASPQKEAARQFRAFLLGSDGRKILSQNGYLVP